jgi:myo-inositol-1(or 4)-monophosphatase
MMNTVLEDVFRVASLAADRASSVMRHYRETNSFSISSKHGETRDLVTTADLEAEKVILKTIHDNFPEHKILSEETKPSFTKEDWFDGGLWIIDPIDGTTNYARGLEHCSTSIAYAYNGEVKVGIVEAPFLQARYSCIKGQGAFRNKIQLKVSETTNIEQCVVATGFPTERNKDKLDYLVARTKFILANCGFLRRFGSASLDICYVASGNFDIYIEDVKPWDVAAATLIAREAGAKVSFLEPEKDAGTPLDLRSQGIIVSNPHLETKFVPPIQELFRTKR